MSEVLTLDNAADLYGQDDSYEALPAGTYKCVVEEALMKTPRNGGADYLNIKFSIVGDKYTNRKFFQTYNYNHGKEVVRNIGRGQFIQVLKAVRAPGDTDVNALFEDPIKATSIVKNKVLFVKVNRKEEEYNGEKQLKNVPNAYYALDDETGKKNAENTSLALNSKDIYGTNVPTAPVADSEIPF